MLVYIIYFSQWFNLFNISFRSLYVMCTTFLISTQWRRLHGARGTCPHFYRWLGTGGTVSRRTANKKLTKLY